MVHQTACTCMYFSNKNYFFYQIYPYYPVHWRYRDDAEIASLSVGELELTDIGLDEAGEYQCKAVSQAGNTYSRTGTLEVAGKVIRQAPCPKTYHPYLYTFNLCFNLLFFFYIQIYWSITSTSSLGNSFCIYISSIALILMEVKNFDNLYYFLFLDASSIDTCEETPYDNPVSLPSGCSYTDDEGNVHVTLNTGRCSNKECTNRTYNGEDPDKCNDITTFCCASLESKVIRS